MAPNSTKRSFPLPDIATVGGIVVSAVAICGGLVLEGGALGDIWQPTALMIVAGGTAGAILVQTPLATVFASVLRLREVFFAPASSTATLIEELLDLAAHARRQGLTSLEDRIDGVTDRFLAKALQLAVDGTDTTELRRMLELEIILVEQRREREAQIWEAAGGYAPTVGIIGAVMGLIQVMKNLADIDRVGHGIAVSFVATIYGVALANLLFLPMGQKMKARARQESEDHEMLIEGVIGIVEGTNPKLIRDKLVAFLSTPPSPARPRAGGASAPAPSRAS